MFRVKSPNNTVSIEIKLDNNGTPRFLIYRKETLCLYGNAGVISSIEDFTKGLQLSYQEDCEETQENYHIPAGKKGIYENHYIESAAHFISNKGVEFIIRVRVFDDGAAFRYEIPNAEDSKNISVIESPCNGQGNNNDNYVKIENEFTSFDFDEEFDQVWLQDLVASYEAPYCRSSWGIQNEGRNFGMPVLVSGKNNNIWVLINEAAVLNRGGDYCVSHVKGTAGRELNLEFANEQKSPITVDLPFSSPWRYACIAEDLDAIVNSVIAYNLNPPSIIDDESWIKPARSLWAWWADDTGAQLFTQVKEYVDYAAAMGFEAVLVDAGWDETWVKEYCDYAHKKSIMAWIWSDRQRLTKPEAAEYLLPLWKSWGVDGVKIDFFEDDSADIAGLYNNLAKISAREHLMINYHGSTKPMGEGRTWPHFLTAEGIMGMEYYKWSDGPDAEHNCTVPFIRNAVGPMDYTPVGFSQKNRNTSMAHQLALSVVFQSGCTHYASSIYNLEAWNGTEFLRRLKPSYEGVKVIAGYPGDYAYILRWTTQPQEYVIGCICNRKRTAQIKLDFLPEGEFEAQIFRDDRLGYEIVKENISVNKGTVLDIPMAEHGGAGIYIAHSIPDMNSVVESGYMCSNYQEFIPEELETYDGSIQCSSSEFDDTPVVWLKGECSFICKDNLPKEYATIRVFYSCEECSTLSVSDGFTVKTESLPISGYGAIFATKDIIFPLNGGPIKLIIKKVSGGSPKISRIRLIHNNPVPSIKIPVETCSVVGGTLLKNENKWKIAGLHKDSVIRLENVATPGKGNYILRMCYLAGTSGKAFVKVNDQEPVTLSLSGGVSYWSSISEEDSLGREILISLDRNISTIIISAVEDLPEITSIELIGNAI